MEEYYRKLVSRYLSKNCSDDELEVFAHLLKDGKLDKYINESMDADVASEATEKWPVMLRLTMHKYMAAASILLFMAAGIYFITKVSNNLNSEVAVKIDIAPGGNKAFLTLSNGTKIDLDNAVSGEVAKQDGVSINKTEEGAVRYSSQKEEKQPSLFNTVSTPYGGQYKVVLSDGTTVWLNSGSSIRFPTTFSDKERIVEMTGEAYFEVAKKQLIVRGHTTTKRIPFIVKTENEEIEVLGTHFNVNAYSDEELTRTTLLEGSVKIRKGLHERLLSPNQQSVTSKDNSNIEIYQADTEEAVSWKNGYFQFKEEELQSILRKISRWYNVEVAYKNTPSGLKYGGMVSREKNISAVLNIMESTGNIHFKIEGRRLTVMP